MVSHFQLSGYNEKPITLQMFIGTADERNLRPHAFYQVHRITGKMVATPSYEALVGSTKVLEMSLLPENNMCANIDCAGILKLRNSDIELRKGETDIGRKNTRVRLVFRVHVPQGAGKGISLQVASIPIECSQRSAQELPQVDNYSLSACSVNGREELLICGSNFLSDSKVIFLEKGPDGKLQWEEESKVNRLKSNESLLSVQVPEYCNKEITRPLQVYFYISNGRRKRSPMQSFRYLPIIFKAEPLPDLALHRFPSNSLTNSCHLSVDSGQMELSTSYLPPLQSNLGDTPMEVSPYYTSPHSERLYPGDSDCAAGSSSFMGCYFNPPVPTDFKCPPSYPENGSDVSLSLPFHSNPALPPSPVPWSPQPCSSHSASASTFGGPLLPHLTQPSKLNERLAVSQEDYSASPNLLALEYDATAHPFSPIYEPFTACAPPSYTTLGEGERLGPTQPVESSTIPTVSRVEQCTPVQQFPSNSIPDHQANHLNSQAQKCRTVAQTVFAAASPSLPPSEEETAFAPTFHNLSSCRASSLTSLCPSSHPSPFSAPSSPSICINPNQSSELNRDGTQTLSANKKEEDVCFHQLCEEYPKSANNPDKEKAKEDGQEFERTFHPIPIHGITLEEVSEFIGEDLHSFPEPHQEE